MPQASDELREKFGFGVGDGDGTDLAEKVIIDNGGSVVNGLIDMPLEIWKQMANERKKEVIEACNFLTCEWDYEIIFDTND